MQLTNTRSIAGSRVDVWATLNDPAALQACIPGCELLERETDREWRSVVATRIGPVAMRFKATITLDDVVPPTSYTLRFDGQGGAAGLAKGNATVTLAEMSPGVTALSYTAEAQVSGKLAQLGSRLIDGVAAKLADEFFANLAAYVASSSGPGPARSELGTAATAHENSGTGAAPDEAISAGPASPDRPREARTSSMPWHWSYTVAIAVVAVAGVVYAFLR